MNPIQELLEDPTFRRALKENLQPLDVLVVILLVAAILVLLYPFNNIALDLFATWIVLWCFFLATLIRAAIIENENKKQQKYKLEFESLIHIFKGNDIIVTYRIILDPVSTIARSATYIESELERILRANPKVDLMLLQKPLGIDIQQIQQLKETDEGFSWGA